jgi:mannose-6-phosphate isomerase-like protein (cupin superfamily)
MVRMHMTDAGNREIFVSPLSGEWVTVLESAAATEDGHVTLELKAAPGEIGLPGLLRDEQTQVLEVLAGTLGVEIEGDVVEALPGDVVVAPADRSTRWWNAGSGELPVRVHVRPAPQLEAELRASLTPLAGGGGLAPAANA